MSLLQIKLEIIPAKSYIIKVAVLGCHTHWNRFSVTFSNRSVSITWNAMYGIVTTYAYLSPQPLQLMDSIRLVELYHTGLRTDYL